MIRRIWRWIVAELGPDTPTLEWREWKARQQAGMAEFADVSFRVVEMVLVTSAVQAVEVKLGAQGLISVFMTALIAIYVRGRAMAAFVPAIDNHETTERTRRVVYWLVWLLCIAIFFAANGVAQIIVPMLVELGS